MNDNKPGLPIQYGGAEPEQQDEPLPTSFEIIGLIEMGIFVVAALSFAAGRFHGAGAVNLDQLCTDAMDRLREFINRSAGQHLRAHRFTFAQRRRVRAGSDTHPAPQTTQGNQK